MSPTDIMRNHMIGLKLSLKTKNLNGNYPKVWPTTQTNILKTTFQRISLKETILCQKPASANLDNDKKLDNFLRGILKEKRKTKEQNIEMVLEKLQCKTIDVMGTLSKLWKRGTRFSPNICK